MKGSVDTAILILRPLGCFSLVPSACGPQDLWFTRRVGFVLVYSPFLMNRYKSQGKAVFQGTCAAELLENVIMYKIILNVPLLKTPVCFDV